MKKLLSLLLLTAILLPSVALLSPFVKSFAKGSGEEVLFTSSFEKGESVSLLQSELEGKLSNISSYSFDDKKTNDFSSYVLPSSLDGSPDGFSGEGKINLFDASADTKYCIDSAEINEQNPITVIFALSAECLVTSYRLTSANDAEARDPKDFMLYGSKDGVTYNLIDSQNNVIFTQRKQARSFSVEGNTEYYSYYKLVVTKVRGEDKTTKGTVLFQLGDISLFGTLGRVEGDDEPKGDSPMATVRSNGPKESSAAYTNLGFTGSSALRVYAEQTAKENTSARNVIYKDLNIKVSENTRLSYVIYPALSDSSKYDYNYTSMFFSVDLLFTDGTYLSDLSALDQNGFGLDPLSQGKSEALYTMQWNYIESNIGEVAKGKTIKSILIYFNMDKTKTKSRFLTYFDDIVIENKEKTVYEHPSDYVSILRGTNNTKAVSRGITVPLVTVPNGFNAYTPANTTDENQPYYYQQNGDACYLRHITVNHTASPWLPTATWGTWQMMPNTSISLDSVTNASQISAGERAAAYTHDNEIARAHYYSVTFNNDDENAAGVKMELTPTSHAAYLRLTYPKSSEHINLILGTEHSGSVTVKTEGGKTIVTGTSSNNVKMYVYCEINAVSTGHNRKDRTVIVSFDDDVETLEVRIATSYISEAQAKKNLSLEISESDTFDKVYRRAQSEWDSVLGVVEPEGASYTQLVTLYSCLYRMNCYPFLYSENTGSAENPVWKYRSPYQNATVSGKLYTANGFWDTYRAEWPALSLLYPTRTGELLDGIIQNYKDGGYIARWLGSGGIQCMMGTHSDIILADAYLKGIEFDAEAAFESMLKNALVNSKSDVYGRPENETKIFTGYVPNSYPNGLSWTIEDYINDFGIALMAKALSENAKTEKEAEQYKSYYNYFLNRSLYYPMMFNTSVKFFMGKNAKGEWTKATSDFNAYSLDWYADYAETNAYNMAFAIVYDIEGLATLYGGKDKLLQKLNKYFSSSSETSVYTGGYTYEQREVRLGLSMFNNQVCYHTPYLYNYLGRPYETQRITSEILSRLFVGSEIGQGYPGDEDNGATSAFYVLTALGLYENALGTGEYLISTPLYEKVTLHLESGDITITAKNRSDENIYIQSCKINGEEYNKTYITYETLTSGDLSIEYVMGSTPSSWGCDDDAAPYSLSSSGSKVTYSSDITKNVKENKILEMSEFNGSVSVNTIYTDGITSPKKLFDDTSDTTSNLSSSATVILALKDTYTLDGVTLSVASKSKAPRKLVIEASEDGEGWKTLAEYSSDFSWNDETIPFYISEEKRDAYSYYKLTITDSSSFTLTEVEFIGAKGEKTVVTPPVTTTPVTSTETPITTSPTPVTSTPTTTDAPNKKGDSTAVTVAVIVTVAVVALSGVSFFVGFKLYKKKKQQ